MALNERREAQDITLRRVRGENRGEGFEVVPEIVQVFREFCSDVPVCLYDYLTRQLLSGQSQRVAGSLGPLLLKKLSPL